MSTRKVTVASLLLSVTAGSAALRMATARTRRQQDCPPGDDAAAARTRRPRSTAPASGTGPRSHPPVNAGPSDVAPGAAGTSSKPSTRAGETRPDDVNNVTTNSRIQTNRKCTRSVS